MIAPLRTAFFVLLVLLSCSSRATSTAPSLQSTTQINTIGSELLAAKLRHKGMRNSMVSPVSLFYALAVLNEGAAGATQAVLQSRLLNSESEPVNVVAAELAEILRHGNKANVQGVGVFNLANSIWAHNGKSDGKPFVFSGAFIDSVQQHYLASANELDFKAPQSPAEVNKWAQLNTNDLIKKIIDLPALNRLVWLIMNAAYFEGGWGTSMARMAPGDTFYFTGIDGIRCEAAAIRSRNYKAPVLDRQDGSVAFRLPFAGGKYSFVVHLAPDKHRDVAAWLQDSAVAELPQVTKEVLDNRSEIYQLSIRMPVFSFTDEVIMRKQDAITEEMGLRPLFLRSAQFSALVDAEKTHPDNRDTAVGIIKQQTRIELDEKGVKAAAVTLIGGISKTSVGPRYRNRDIVVDRPFAFSIVENRSQTILFNGVYTGQ
jgi:serpin B